MNRYQIYLDPNSVQTFDNIAEAIGESRSRIIRDVLDRAAREYKKVLSATSLMRIKDNPLLKMAGFAKSPTGKVSKGIDEIYLKD